VNPENEKNGLEWRPDHVLCNQTKEEKPNKTKGGVKEALGVCNGRTKKEEIRLGSKTNRREESQVKAEPGGPRQKKGKGDRQGGEKEKTQKKKNHII